MKSSPTASLLTVFGIIALTLLVALIYPRYMGPSVPQGEEPELQGQEAVVIPLRHNYSSGTHAYIGVVPVPTPCHILEASAIVRESFPEQVDIVVVSHPGEGVCAQVLSQKKFKVAFTASSDAYMSIFLDGRRASSTVTEVSTEENLAAEAIE